jgi:hypothetical protein
MKLIISFGHSGTKKEVHWYRDIMEFPKLLRFAGAKWEWAMYHNIGDDYELTFSQIPAYDPNYYVDMESFEDRFEWGQIDKCVCGAIFSSFSWDHLRYCPKHKPWSQI